MINFKLRELDQIQPWGQEPKLSLNWFGMTDGELWLKFGNETIYEYSKKAVDSFEGGGSQYNDYQLVRFIEDFSRLFEKISQSIPDNFYLIAKNLSQLRGEARKWLEMHENEENFYSREYEELLSWVFERTLDSSHLIGGPYLFFFRHKDKIRIVWDTEFTLENGISLWKAKNGSFEIDYSEFVNEVKEFGIQFFKAMDKQVELALVKDWQNVAVDKTRLLQEHNERKLEFEENIALLEQQNKDETNWSKIYELYERMKKEIK